MFAAKTNIMGQPDFLISAQIIKNQPTILMYD